LHFQEEEHELLQEEFFQDQEVVLHHSWVFQELDL